MSEPNPPPVLPWDTHNQKLVSNVHPLDWQNPMPASRYNLVVIGGGTAGLVTAVGAAGLGAKVALVEKHFMGGDCLNVGCVPSKAIIRAARAIASVREAAEFGVNVPAGATADFGKVMERMRRLRADISPHDSAKRFTELGVDVFLGAGKFTGPDTIEVGGQTQRFAKAVIATGARAAAPPIPGLKDVPYLTNETLFSLTELPKRLGIIGAGPIGCEMAQSFARFGAEVFLIEATHGILPREDQDAAAIVKAAMERDGIKLLCCGKDLKVSKAGLPLLRRMEERAGERMSLDEAAPLPDPLPTRSSRGEGNKDGGVRLQVESHGKGYDVEVDQLLVAVGRAPNVEGLGLKTAGVEFDKKGVKVNDRLQTTNPRVYACGDICSAYQFTHAADFMARIVIQNALFKGRAKAGSLIIPWSTYTSPEIAHVGLYEKDAKARCIEVDTFTQELSKVDRAILDGETEGFVRIHVRKGTDEIVGATIVATHAGELIGELTLAMKGKLGLKTIGATIHPYPTQAEAIRKIGDLYNRIRLTPFIKNLMNRWLVWQR
jgi:pyruvate/2-oxoglutarate dehydrogenase complex dihydrolipoamide dehydrogenase (E3) component